MFKEVTIIDDNETSLIIKKSKRLYGFQLTIYLVFTTLIGKIFFPSGKDLHDIIPHLKETVFRDIISFGLFLFLLFLIYLIIRSVRILANKDILTIHYGERKIYMDARLIADFEHVDHVQIQSVLFPGDEDMIHLYTLWIILKNKKKLKIASFTNYDRVSDAALQVANTLQVIIKQF